MNPLGALLGRRELVANLVSREPKAKYKSSVLGLLWSLITPLFMALIYVVFLRLLARGVAIDEVIIGVFAWQFTVSSVQDGMQAITGNANLVKKVFFPRFILPVCSTLANLVNYLLSLVVQFIIVSCLLMARGEGLSATTWLVVVIIVYQLLFNTGLALVLSGANVYFRDTQHLVGVLLSAWFFISPVMYNIDLVRPFVESRPWILKLYMLNPIAGIVECYRASILPGKTWPFLEPAYGCYALAGLVWPLVLLPLAYLLFQRLQRNFSDML